MGVTSIEWTDRSVNPIRARNKRTGAAGHYCEKISHGCTHCYASNFQPRFKMPTFPAHGTSARLTLPMANGDSVPVADEIEMFLDQSKLQEVLRRKVPTKWFWCDMTDMFGSWVPDEWISACFQTMGMTPQHTHQVLTKRPERMRDFVSKFVNRPGRDPARMGEVDPNIWLGVSVEDQPRADERIPLLLQTPAAVRFLSVEPMLGPIDLRQAHMTSKKLPNWPAPTRVDWVIVGGESGHGARPFNIAWARSIVEQCKSAGVPCFVKQLGAVPIIHCGQCGKDIGRIRGGWVDACGPTHAALIAESKRIIDRKGGDLDELPEDLRVREFPN